jgi:hypothetical protein
VEGGEIQPWPAGAWQRLRAAVITRSGELTELAAGPLATGGGPYAAAAERQFGVRVPRGFAKRIRHLLDRVRGAAHFEVPEADALRLVAGVRDRMPGYLVPRLVREVAGAPSKVAVELRDEG